MNVVELASNQKSTQCQFKLLIFFSLILKCTVAVIMKLSLIFKNIDMSGRCKYPNEKTGSYSGDLIILIFLGDVKTEGYIIAATSI